MKNAVNWFQIPAVDFYRAHKFYSTIFDFEMPTSELNGVPMAFFDSEKGVGGAVVQVEGLIPSTDGILVFLNGGSDLSEVLNRVEGAGGKILTPKTLISPQIGFYAFLLDTEGNKVALHSMQ
jgi:uncharacterized protein